jgi:hypothetical protein
MKIISFLIVSSILIGLTLNLSTENLVVSSSAAEGQINLNSGLLGSISKYKLKNKSKSKSKNKTLNKVKAASGAAIKANTAEQSTTKAHTGEAQAVASPAPLPAGGVNVLSGGNPTSRGNINMALKAGPKLWEGWAKFYVYKTTDEKDLLKGTQKTKKFFKNYEFYEQFKKDANLNVEEVVGTEFKNIHDPYSFYVSLFPNNINFSNSRVVRLFIYFYFLIY